MKQKYIIAKFADRNKWKGLYKKDPKISGLTITFSACFTEAGRKLQIQNFYEDKEQAENDLLRIQLENPRGGYAICPLITSSFP